MFDFGSNWREFSASKIDSSRLAEAAQSIEALLGPEALKGASFLDVGCGSGLFSLAAHRLGAARIVGLDINSRSIEASQSNRRLLAPQGPISFVQASALDPLLPATLGQFDVVYAWGSLHHTGAMWQAIRQVSELVSPGGTLVLSIYNRHVTSPIWRRIKRLYNQLPRIGQRLMAIAFAGVIYVAKWLVTFRNPLRKERGMDFWYDVVDWVGGYPYEYATPEEVEGFMAGLGFVQRRFQAAGVPTGCNEFVFGRGV